MKYHPDRNQGNDVQFKKIQEAYETLSDAGKRQQYDNPQQFNNPNGFGGNPFGSQAFDDVFSNFFGGRGPRRYPQNRDITISAMITLEEAFIGKKLLATYRLFSGRDESVEIEIPPGANHNDTIRYGGLGDDTDGRFPRGNLNVRIQVNKHNNFVRENDNLYIVKKVNIFDLLLGSAIIVKTIEGKELSVNIPKGTMPGTKLSIKDYGMPNVNTRIRGNLYIIVEPVIPKIEDENILKKLREIKDAIS